MNTYRPAAASLVETLKANNIRHLFSLSGNQILSIYDACLEQGLDLIHVRHEAAAVHMADAWGRLTETPGVALVSAGPGHANTLSALCVATAAESPLVLLSGHCPDGRLGRGAFQEMAQSQIAEPLVKASWTVTDPSCLGTEFKKAFSIATEGRPGPVHLSLPVNVLESLVNVSDVTIPSEFVPQTQVLSESSADEILELLSLARSPLILVGPAMMRPRGRKLTCDLRDITHIPVVGMESPRGIADPCLGAFAEILTEADLILLLGKKLDFSLSFGSQEVFSSTCRFLQIDPELLALEQVAYSFKDSSRLKLAAQAETFSAAEQLVHMAKERTWIQSGWFEEVREAIQYRPLKWENLKAPKGSYLHPAEVCREIGCYLDGSAVFVSDGGEFGQWAQACLETGTRVINGPSGAIGGSLPFALAARLAYPSARVVVTLGDGTFGFQAMEFDTAVRHQLPFVAVVGNDACWNAEKQQQLQRYGPNRQFGCNLLPTRYDRVVEALGGHGEYVTSALLLPKALKRAFHSPLPACVNVRIQSIAAPVVQRTE